MFELESVILHETLDFGGRDASICLHACVYNYTRVILSRPSYLPDGSLLCLSLPVSELHFTGHSSSALTVRAGFVDKVAEVEQGGPGSQVLNEPLRKTNENSGGKWSYGLMKNNTLMTVIRLSLLYFFYHMTDFSDLIPWMAAEPTALIHLFDELRSKLSKDDIKKITQSSHHVLLISLNKPRFKHELRCTRCERVSTANLVAVDTHVMGGDEGLEDDHPAGVGGSLEQRVSHLGDVHVGGVGGWHQVCNTATQKKHRHSQISYIIAVGARYVRRESGFV